LALAAEAMAVVTVQADLAMELSKALALPRDSLLQVFGGRAEREALGGVRERTGRAVGSAALISPVVRDIAAVFTMMDCAWTSVLDVEENADGFTGEVVVVWAVAGKLKAFAGLDAGGVLVLSLSPVFFLYRFCTIFSASVSNILDVVSFSRILHFSGLALEGFSGDTLVGVKDGEKLEGWGRGASECGTGSGGCAEGVGFSGSSGNERVSCRTAGCLEEAGGCERDGTGRLAGRLVSAWLAGTCWELTGADTSCDRGICESCFRSDMSPIGVD
jgi:hypothetical protein